MTFKPSSFKTFKSAFSNDLKRILGAPRYASSHVAASLCNMPLLKNHVMIKKNSFYLRLICNPNPMIKNISSLKNNFLYKDFLTFFKSKYEVDICNNDKDALVSRVMWVQLHEERSRRCPFFNLWFLCCLLQKTNLICWSVLGLLYFWNYEKLLSLFENLGK